MARKPDILSDRDDWGAVLNDYLDVSLNEDGTIREEAVAGLGVETTVTDAVGEWWIHPVATYQDQPYPRTVFGAIASDGKVLACEFNHGTGKTKRYEVAQAVVDDHCVPSLWVMDGHRSVVAWSNHARGGPDGESSWEIHVKTGAVSGDLGSIAHSQTASVNLAWPASYTQLYRIESLSDDETDYFWCFSRTGSPGSQWRIRPFTVNQGTGEVAFPGTSILYLESANNEQIYCSTADAYASDGQVIRIGIGYNPAEAIHAIRYLEVDTVTGDITNPFDESLFANVDGTNLPLADTSIVPALPDPGALRSRRFFYTRPGPDTMALAYAEWDTDTPTAARYFLTEYNPNGVAGMVPDSGYAQAAYSAALDADANGFSYTVVIETPSSLPDNILELGRRYGSLNGWFFRLTPDKQLAFTVVHNSGSSTGTTSETIPFDWGDVIGLRLAVNPDDDSFRRFYSLDPLSETPTWTELGEPVVNAFSSVITTSQPLIVPTNNASYRGIPRVLVATLHSHDGEVIAGADFVNDWTPGATEYTDPQGNSWSLSGAASVSTPPLVTYDLGPTGAKLGYTDAANYVAGLAFDDPSYDRAVIRARSDGTTDTVEKLRLVAGAYEPEVIAQQASSDGRLVRPIVPVNGGPFAALVTNMTNYAGYEVYEGNVKGVS